MNLSERFLMQGFLFPHAVLFTNILDENKKYIAAIFNILDDNKKYGDENISLRETV